MLAQNVVGKIECRILPGQLVNKLVIMPYPDFLSTKSVLWTKIIALQSLIKIVSKSIHALFLST